jgi:cell division initiation protein
LHRRDLRREPHVRLTPLDIRNQTFQKRMSGYDREEVESFLRLVSEDYEGALREIQQLKDKLSRLEVRVEELGSNEKLLQDTLTTAQRLGEDLKRTAIKEAEVLLGEAELKGEKILDAAHRRAAKLAEDIREMKSLRTRLATSVRATIETHLAILESLEIDRQGEAELGEKVAYLGAPPRVARVRTAPAPSTAPAASHAEREAGGSDSRRVERDSGS